MDVEELCQYVAESLTESDPARGTRYVWETRLYAAAGIDPHQDDAATVRAKMQSYWNRNREALVCNVPNSVVRDGSILKLAVDRSSTEFLTSAIRRWDLDLNQIDSDGKTVLDFVEDELAKAAGSSRERTLQRYRNWLLSGGARRAVDLRTP